MECRVVSLIFPGVLVNLSDRFLSNCLVVEKIKVEGRFFKIYPGTVGLVHDFQKPELLIASAILGVRRRAAHR